MSARGAAAATDGAAVAAAAVPPPSLSQLAHSPLKFLPSLLPACDNAAASSSSSSSSGAASLRDSHAEAAQQRLVWSSLDADASLLLRLPLSSFLSHALFNKSLHRFVENFLAQIATVWEQATGETYTRSYWRTHSDADDGDDEEDEEKSAAVQIRTSAAAASSEQQAVLRSLAKRVLLIYVRLCSTTLLPVDANGNAVVPAAPTADAPPLWLTSLFFTTSFSASPLFSPALLFDLCAFYSSVGRDAHRPLLALVLGRAADRLPYAFGQGMTAAVGALVQALHTQIRIIHAPFLAGTGGKKARFTRDEVQALVRNLAGLLWPLYSLCRIRTDVLRLLLQGVGAVPAAKSKSNGTAPPPPFLALLSCLYSVTPLLLLNELGVKPAHLSSQPAIVHLRKGCLKFLDLIMRKALFKPMGVRVERARNGSVGRSVSWSAPRAVDPKAPAPVSAAAATVSSTLPPSLTMVTACDTFFHALQLLHTAVNDDTKTEGLCALPTPMRNLVKANTPAALNACIRRANELFEFDAVLALLLQQAQQKVSGSPGVLMGESRVVQLLKLLQQVDAPLLRERIHWPPPAATAAASSSSSSSKGMLDDEEQKGPAPLSVSLSRGASKAGGGDQSLAITELHDLFPSLYSSDYLSACLSEFNNDVEATTKALLEQSLPAYLQQIRDKARYRAGDHQLDSKLRRPDFDLFSRQSSSGFSSGSGLLDIAVDDEDEEAARHTLDVDDGAAFEMFLRRTGRVSKQQLEEKQRAQSKGLGLDSGSSSGGGVLNAFGKGEAALLASKIQSSLNRFDAEEDEYDDAFDDFENFAVDGNDATELEERAAAFDRRGGGAQDADEPDGSYQRNYNSRTSQQQQQRHAPQSQQNNRDRPSIRGGRGGAAAASGGRSGAGRGGDEHVSVPASFMPEMTAGSSSGAAPDVREQWRRDAHRKELFVATVKAQKAQALAPSRRTREQEEDYQHGLRQGLIENLERPQTGRQQPQQQNKNQQQQQSQQPRQQQQPQQQQSRNNQQPQQQQQQQQRPQSAQHGGGGGDSHRGDGAARGGFSMRGGRGGGRGGGALSASASSFTPSGGAPGQQAGGGAARPQSAAAPVPAQQHQPHQQQQQQQQPAHSHATPVAASSGSVPSRWDEASDGDDGSGDDGDSSQQQQGVGGGGRGGRQSGQPMDLRQKKRKEKNKGIIGNHNRKAGAARKQGVQF